MLIGGLVLLLGVECQPGAGLSGGAKPERVAQGIRQAPAQPAAYRPEAGPSESDKPKRATQGTHRTQSRPAVPHDIWPMSGHDPARTSRSVESLPPPLRKAWQVALPAKPTPQLWVGRDKLIIVVWKYTSPHSQVLAFDLQGQERWRYVWPEPNASIVDGGLSERAGVVVVQGQDSHARPVGMIRALRLADGQVLWEYPLSALSNGLCLAEPAVYVADQTPAGEAVALALEVSNGHVRYQSEPVSVPNVQGTVWAGQPVADGQRVIFLFGSGNGGVGISWSPDLTQRHWIHKRGHLDGRSDRQALVDGVWWWGEGSKLWRLQAENPERGLVGSYWPGTALLAFADRVVIGNHHWHWISAWDREHLKPIHWRRRVAISETYPIVAGPHVWVPAQSDRYYGGDQGGLRAYTVNKGRLVYATNDGSTRALALAGGRLYRAWISPDGGHFRLTAYTSDPQGPPFRNLSLEWAGSEKALWDGSQPLSVELWNTGQVPERNVTVVADASVVPSETRQGVVARHRYRQQVARLWPDERRVLQFPRPAAEDRQEVWWTVYTAPDRQSYRGDDRLASFGAAAPSNAQSEPSKPGPQ